MRVAFGASDVLKVVGRCVVTVAGDLEDLFTEPLGLVGFIVELEIVPVTLLAVGVVGVDPVGDGPGVGCPVNDVPVHVLPSEDMFIPFGHRQLYDFTLTAKRHRWEHPPLLTLHGLGLDTKKRNKKNSVINSDFICA